MSEFLGISSLMGIHVPHTCLIIWCENNPMSVWPLWGFTGYRLSLTKQAWGNTRKELELVWYFAWNMNIKWVSSLQLMVASQWCEMYTVDPVDDHTLSTLQLCARWLLTAHITSIPLSSCVAEQSYVLSSLPIMNCCTLGVDNIVVASVSFWKLISQTYTWEKGNGHSKLNLRQSFHWKMVNRKTTMKAAILS